jgi:pimeloyl-ACP methyl ester carboxylesterase
VGDVVVDRDAGTSERVFYFGPTETKMIGWLHVPSGQARAGIVICPSTEAEMAQTRRREALLARSLACRGFAVQRFQYRGSGNSYGAPSDMTFSSMLDDAAAAARHLSDAAEVSAVGFVGVRLGGIVAAATAARLGPCPLALWEPTLEGRSQLREGLRRRLMQDIKSAPNDSVRPSTEHLIAALQQAGHLDIGGYPLYREFYASWNGVQLAEYVKKAERSPVLLVIFADGLSAKYRQLVDHWNAEGLAVECVVIKEQIDWWFPNVKWIPDEQLPATATLIDTTASWFESIHTDMRSATS